MKGLREAVWSAILMQMESVPFNVPAKVSPQVATDAALSAFTAYLEDEAVVERAARGILRDEIEGYRESDLLLDEHFEWWRRGKANPESCVHFSSIGVAMRRARAALAALKEGGANG